MYCPQCGTESGSGLQYCRSCGANLKVIGKALTLSEAIARSDRGPLPKIKEMFRSLKVDQVTEEVSGALERMNKEILRTSYAGKPGKPWWSPQWPIGKKTPEERRENHVVKGTATLFGGVGFMIFLYYFSAALVLKLPPDVIAEIPFELEPVVRILWLAGLVPALSGAGRLVAGLLIRPARNRSIETTSHSQGVVPRNAPQGILTSVTEHTTSLLEPPD